MTILEFPKKKDVPAHHTADANVSSQVLLTEWVERNRIISDEFHTMSVWKSKRRWILCFICQMSCTN